MSRPSASLPRAGGVAARTPVEVVRSSGEFFNCLNGAAVVLAQRLHVAVLAAAAGVPFVMIDYQPKCADFVASVDADEASIRTDEVTADRLEELVLSVATNDLLAAGLPARRAAMARCPPVGSRPHRRALNRSAGHNRRLGFAP